MDHLRALSNFIEANLEVLGSVENDDHDNVRGADEKLTVNTHLKNLMAPPPLARTIVSPRQSISGNLSA